ncbi:MAG: lipocalin family protein [Phycisphaerales bacterium]|nr:lipocalin family protein [Phycisphaerales bacterium]
MLSLGVLPILGSLACSAFYPSLPTVESVDLARYAGKWYEIARYPNFFEPDCVGVTAEYTLRDDGRVDVLNTCRKLTLDGEVETIEGIARTVDGSSNAKLRVSFFPPFEGDYWIIELDKNYEYAVVGEPSRSFLWILSREPELDSETYAAILANLPNLNYDPDRLERVTQIPTGN